jgi:hypothetical protein
VLTIYCPRHFKNVAMRPENYGTIMHWETLLKAGQHLLETSMPGLNNFCKLALDRLIILPLSAIHISILKICTVTKKNIHEVTMKPF